MKAGWPRLLILGAGLLAGSASAREQPALDASLNLHNHTYCSDGSDTPEALVRLAAKSGIRVLSITDHDNTLCIDRAREEARKTGIGFVAGIELSAGDDSMHLLGLNIDPAHPGLRSIIESSRKARLERSREILAKLSQARARDGRPIQITLKELLVHKLTLQNAAEGKPAPPGGAEGLTEDQLLAAVNAPMMRPDIAVVMVKKGYVPNTRAAFDQYLGDEGSASAELAGPPFAEAIRAIHEAGGIAVLAHPYTIYKGKPLPLIIEGKPYARFEDLLRALFDAGLDGVEQYKNGGKGTVPWIVDSARAYSAQSGRHILLTPGSDYHGSSGVGQPRLDPISIPAAEAETLRAALKVPTAPKLGPSLTAERKSALEDSLRSHGERPDSRW